MPIARCVKAYAIIRRKKVMKSMNSPRASKSYNRLIELVLAVFWWFWSRKFLYSYHSIIILWDFYELIKFFEIRGFVYFLMRFSRLESLVRIINKWLNKWVFLLIDSCIYLELDHSFNELPIFFIFAITTPTRILKLFLKLGGKFF